MALFPSFLRARCGSLIGLATLFLGLSPAGAEIPASEFPRYVEVKGKESLIHLGSLDSFDITPRGIEAAALVLKAVTTNDKAAAESAIKIYKDLIPSENFGGEYTALQWICEYQIADEKAREALTTTDITRDWLVTLSKDNWTPLQTYLKQKYHLEEWKNKATPKEAPEYRFLEDFVLFNNPHRKLWEKTDEILSVVDIRKNDVIADIGSGPGYFTFAFSKMVGPQGKIYAIDTNVQHMDYVAQYVKKYDVKNVEPVVAQVSGFKLSEKADVAYLCSLYHNVYAISSEEERGKFIQSIKDTLKPDGRVILIDNSLVADKTLPYHGPYIAKELVLNQFRAYGFRFVRMHQFIPQRYVLEFRLGGEPEKFDEAKEAKMPANAISLKDKKSLVRAPRGASSPSFSLVGRRAARVFYHALETRKPEDFKKAIAAYDEIIPKDRFGDEYTAFQWVCSYELATPKERETMLKDWQSKEYIQKVSENDYDKFKVYLKYKYYFDAIMDDEDVASAPDPKTAVKVFPDQLQYPENAPMTLDQMWEFSEYVTFNNPNRENWEHTSRMLDFLRISPGETVADVGSGSGYYTFKFAALTGSNGKVYAVDTMQAPLDSITGAMKRNGITNVIPLKGEESDAKLPEQSADLIYICSMYHAVYFSSMEYVRTSFVESLRRALKQQGRLVIVDNSILADEEHPYYGPGIAPELVIQQLQHFGFELVDRVQGIPQRYVLVFRLGKPPERGMEPNAGRSPERR